ncbi:hypothetical protein [Streptomyces hypolithicus]
MTPQNPAAHAKIAADAFERLVQDVKTGRAQWSHPHHVRQAVDDLTRLSDAVATTLHQMAAALATLNQPGPQHHQTLAALGLAGQAEATAATHLRQARRTMH